MFPVLPLTGFTFLNLFGLLGCLVMWLPVIKILLPNFSNRAIGIINFERLNPNFMINNIADTMNLFLNSMLD